MFLNTLTISVLFSGALIVALAVHDPKRLRNTEPLSALRPHSSAARRLLAILALAPFIFVLTLTGWSGALIWFGSITVVGWLAALFLSLRFRPVKHH